MSLFTHSLCAFAKYEPLTCYNRFGFLFKVLINTLLHHYRNASILSFLQESQQHEKELQQQLVVISGQIAKLESENENLQEQGKEVENDLFLCQKECDTAKNDFYTALSELDGAKNDLFAAENELEQLAQQLEKEEKAKDQMELQNIQLSTKLNHQDEEILKVKIVRKEKLVIFSRKSNGLF